MSEPFPQKRKNPSGFRDTESDRRAKKGKGRSDDDAKTPSSGGSRPKDSAVDASSAAVSRMIDRAQAVSLNKEIAFHANRKNLNQARAAFDKAVANGWANNHTYAAILNAYVRCGDIEGARTVFAELESSPKVKLDVVSATTMIKGLCGAGDVAGAIALLRSMKARRPPVAPNIRTVNTVLRGCVSTGSVREGDEVFSMLKKEFQIQPDQSSWEYEGMLF
jgi:pentatricopeptide repeat protein